MKIRTLAVMPEPPPPPKFVIELDADEASALSDLLYAIANCSALSNSLYQLKLELHGKLKAARISQEYERPHRWAKKIRLRKQ